MPALFDVESADLLAKQESLEKTYGELQAIKTRIEHNTQVTEEDILAMEALFPGSLLDNYPLGGYKGQKVNVALEAIGNKEGWMMAGIIGGIIAIIIGIIKMISSMFGGASSSSSSRAERSDKNKEKIDDLVKETREQEKKIEAIKHDVGAGRDIPPEEKKQFVETLNEKLDMQMPETTALDQSIKKAMDESEKRLYQVINVKMSEMVVELYHNADGQKRMRAVHDFIKDLQKDHGTEWTTMVEAADIYATAMEVSPSEKLGRPAAYILATKIHQYKASMCQDFPNLSPADAFCRLLGNVQRPSASPLLNLSRVDDVKRWSDNINRYLNNAVIPEARMKEAKDLQATLEKMQEKASRSIGGEEVTADNEYFSFIKQQLNLVISDLRVLRSLLSGADVANTIVSEYHTQLKTALTKYYDELLIIEKASVKIAEKKP